MYHCDSCQRPVAARAGDPIHVTSSGRYCAGCLQTAARASQPSEPAGQTRGEAAKARWAAMTDEQKAERVAALQAGRKNRR